MKLSLERLSWNCKSKVLRNFHLKVKLYFHFWKVLSRFPSLLGGFFLVSWGNETIEGFLGCLVADENNWWWASKRDLNNFFELKKIALQMIVIFFGGCSAILASMRNWNCHLIQIMKLMLYVETYTSMWIDFLSFYLLPLLLQFYFVLFIYFQRHVFFVFFGDKTGFTP